MVETNFFIEKGADDWNWGLSNATEGGHMHLMQFFIEKGCDINILSPEDLQKYDKYQNGKQLIRSIDYNNDLLEEILSYY